MNKHLATVGRKNCSAEPGSGSGLTIWVWEGGKEGKERQDKGELQESESEFNNDK